MCARLYPEQIEALLGRNIPYSSLGGDRSGHSVGKVARIDLGSLQTVVHGGTRTIVGTYSYMPHFLNFGSFFGEF